MKKNVFFLICFFQIYRVFAQADSKALQFDSLTRVLANAQSDTDRVLIYDKLMSTAPTDKIGVEYGMKGFELAKRIHYDEGAILCGNNTGFTMVQLDHYKAAQLLLETKHTCEMTHNEYELARCLCFLGYAYNYSDFQKSITYYRDGKKLIDKLNISQSILPINAIIGNCFKDNNMPDSALIYIQKGYAYALKSPIPIPPNSFYVNFGEVYYQKGQPDTAMSFFRQSIATAKKN